MPNFLVKIPPLEIVAIVLYDSMVTLLVVLSVVTAFRIKRAEIRFWFFQLPLIKPFVVIFTGPSLSGQYSQFLPPTEKAIIGVMRLPDPLQLIPHLPLELAITRWPSPLLLIGTIIGVIVVAAVLVSRWLGLYFFYQRLAREELISKEECPNLFAALDEIVPQFKTAYPKVALTHEKYLGPFTVGVKKPTIVISANLIETLSEDQLKVVLSHELAHIKRKDNLLHWLTVIIRDVTFFSPFSHFTYGLVEREREKACDEMVLKHTSTTSQGLADTLVAVVSHGKESNLRSPQSTPGTSHSLIRYPSALSRRVGWLLKSAKRRPPISLPKKLGLSLLFILILYIQTGMGISQKGYFLFLR